MYRIAVVAEQEREALHYAEQIARFCGEKGMFPKIEPYDDPERFFDAVGRDAPTNAVIALSGVAGLNTAEHLRSLDLDFSLHAFRLRADYFLLKPVTDEAFRQGLRVWGE